MNLEFGTDAANFMQSDFYVDDGLKSVPSVDGTTARQRNKYLKGTSSLYRLDPFLDNQGIMRVGGRIRRAANNPSFNHPMILPRKHHITNLIIRHFHKHVQHQGRGMTTNEIRSNGFWIVGCSSAVAHHIKQCVLCRKLRSGVSHQKMSDLPEDRLEPAPPFTYCGVNFFGPWTIKGGRKELKRYGVLFTCMGCRAIHLETVITMETDSFINALRRFLLIRGPIRKLRSDQGTNLVGAKNELERALSEIDNTQVQQFLLKQGCSYFRFNMNVPSASHMGGSWERHVRTVRSSLSSLLDEAGLQLNDESLRTLMCEAAAIVNSRPLTVDSLYDVTSLEPLTPNHLLTLKSKVILPPPGEFLRADVYARRRWRRVQHLANEFWTRWKKEFLQTLQLRRKWVQPKRDLHIGDIVIINDSNLPRNQWKLARVEKTFSSKDNKVRSVQLAIADHSLDEKGKRTRPISFLKCPIHKLVLLLEKE